MRNKCEQKPIVINKIINSLNKRDITIKWHQVTNLFNSEDMQEILLPVTTLPLLYRVLATVALSSIFMKKHQRDMLRDE